MSTKKAKKGMKKPAKAKAKPKKSSMKAPPAEMMQEVQDVLGKHGWSGSMIMKPAGATAATAANPCPPGTTPQEISFQRPDGTWVSRIICV